MAKPHFWPPPPHLEWVDCDIAAQLTRHLDAAGEELYPLAAVSKAFREAVAGVSLTVYCTNGDLTLEDLKQFLKSRTKSELLRITRFRLRNVGAKFLDALAKRVKEGTFQALKRVEVRGPHAVLFYSKLIGLPCEDVPQRDWTPLIEDEYLLTQMVIAAEDGTPNADDFCSVIRAQREGGDKQNDMTYRYWIGRSNANQQAASGSWLNKYFDSELDRKTGREMIHLAAAYGRLAVLAQLRAWVTADSPWDFSCFIFKPDGVGKTAVCYAVRRQDIEMLRFLLQSSQSGEVLDDDPDIACHPLLLCALAGRAELSLRRDGALVQDYVGKSKGADRWTAMGLLLIEHRCNLEAGAQDQLRPLEACIRTGDDELFAALVEAAREEAAMEDRPYVLKSSAIDMARQYGRDRMLRALVALEEASRCPVLLIDR